MKYLWLIAVFLFSCNIEKTEKKAANEAGAEPNYKYKIAIEPSEKGFRASSAFSNIRYVQLETVKDNLVGNIDKLLFHKDRIYVLDIRSAKSLFVFLKDGKFINAVKSSGRGPEEFMQPDDCIIDSFNETINILDRDLRKILVYDLEGNFLHENAIGLKIHSMAAINKNTRAFYTNRYTNPRGQGDFFYSLYYYEGDKQVDAFLPFSKQKLQIRFAPQSVFSSRDEMIYFMPSRKDTVFRVAASGLIPHIYVDFGEKKRPASLFSSDQTWEKFHKERNKYCGFIANLQESKRHIYFTFMNNGYLHAAIYSKITENILTSYIVGNDLDGAPFGIPIGQVEGELAGVIEPVELLNIFAKVPERFSGEALKVAKSVTEMSNPILAFYELKDF